MVTNNAYLSCPMDLDNDSGAQTVGGYLSALLITLYYEGEGFSGKRPFGNSGWEDDVAEAWVRAGLLPGEVSKNRWDEDEVEYEPSTFLTVLRSVLQDALEDGESVNSEQGLSEQE